MSDNFSELVLTKETLPIVMQMAENIPGGFFVYKDTEKAEIIFVNHAVLDMYGCENLEEFKAHTGYTFNGMVHPEDFIKIQSSIDLQIDRSEENMDYVEYRIIRKDGSVRYVEDFGHFSQTEDFGNIYYVFITDVTDKYKLGIAKNTFLFNSAHDIKAPLGEIKRYTKLLQKSIGNKIPESEYVSQIADASLYAGGVVNELVEASELYDSNIVVKEMICNIDEEGAKIQSLADKKEGFKNQNFYFDMPSELVYMDPELFGRVLGNLIGNAVKYTPDGGSIDVTGTIIGKSDTGYGRFKFTIADNGIGMSESFLKRVFGLFEREMGDTGDEYIGAGIGFSLVKKAAYAMGGSLDIESKPNEGTTVTVYLPLKLYNEYRKPEVIESEEENKKKILVVEHIAENRALIEKTLTEAGFIVDVVCDGCDGFDMFEAHSPNYYSLIITEIQMPIMTGYEEIYKIRHLDREDAKNTPIFVISSEEDKEDRLKVAESGANGHISSPISKEDLLFITNTLLGKK